MAVDKMLVAFDESEGSKKALKTASELAAANPNAHIDLVYVVPIPMLNSDQMASFQSILDLMISDGEDLLAAAASDMGDDVASRTDSLLLTGTNPASEILRLADQREYDMIVIGNRGLSGLKEIARSQTSTDLIGRLRVFAGGQFYSADEFVYACRRRRETINRWSHFVACRLFLHLNFGSLVSRIGKAAICYFALSSQKATALAAATLRLSTPCAIGMRTV